jgi:hypothetical protein
MILFLGRVLPAPPPQHHQRGRFGFSGAAFAETLELMSTNSASGLIRLGVGQCCDVKYGYIMLILFYLEYVLSAHDVLPNTDPQKARRSRDADWSKNTIVFDVRIPAQLDSHRYPGALRYQFIFVLVFTLFASDQINNDDALSWVSLRSNCTSCLLLSRPLESALNI